MAESGLGPASQSGHTRCQGATVCKTLPYTCQPRMPTQPLPRPTPSLVQMLAPFSAYSPPTSGPLRAFQSLLPMSSCSSAPPSPVYLPAPGKEQAPWMAGRLLMPGKETRNQRHCSLDVLQGTTSPLPRQGPKLTALDSREDLPLAVEGSKPLHRKLLQSPCAHTGRICSEPIGQGQRHLLTSEYLEVPHKVRYCPLGPSTHKLLSPAVSGDAALGAKCPTSGRTAAAWVAGEETSKHLSGACSVATFGHVQALADSSPGVLGTDDKKSGH